MAEVKYIKYICTSCKAEDEVKLFSGCPTPMAINCHSCKAGQKMELQHMLQTRIGMFPVIEN